MFYHICVSVEWELERIRKWEWTVLWDCSSIDARNILQQAKSDWKTHRAWCDNMSQEWRCLWHNKEKEWWKK